MLEEEEQTVEKELAVNGAWPDEMVQRWKKNKQRDDDEMLEVMAKKCLAEEESIAADIAAKVEEESKQFQQVFNRLKETNAAHSSCAEMWAKQHASQAATSSAAPASAAPAASTDGASDDGCQHPSYFGN